MATEATQLIPERNKRDGVLYAFTANGVELPIIDVTNPAFAIEIDAEETDRRYAEFLESEKRRARVPAFLMNLFLRIVLRKSVLAKAFGKAKDSFLSGMATYLLKLGPENLGAGYSEPIDRTIAASLPVLMVRLRLQDVANLLAGAVRPQLVTQPGAPIHFLNIAGGPAMEDLNALILLRRKDPALLEGRRIFIHILDLVAEGPAFGANALRALRVPGAPLHGLDVTMESVDYNWADTPVLRELVERLVKERAVFAASSEGGLFDYGSDEEIVANLQALSALRCPVIGTVTRALRPGEKRGALGVRAAVLHRGLRGFTPLVSRAGFRICRAVERLFSDSVWMEPAPSD